MTRIQLLCVTSAVTILIASCGTRQDPVSASSPASISGVQALLASGARLDSAHLLLSVRVPGGEQIVVHPAGQPWFESTVTWDDAGSGVGPFGIATFAALDTGTVKVDVSSLVNGWLRGTALNYGILLVPKPTVIQCTRFDSREQGATGPKLKLYLSNAGSPVSWTVRASGDAYLDPNRPDANTGSENTLQIGFDPGGPGEYRVMMYFDLAASAASAAVGDRVWEDRNGDGIQNGDEIGVPGVTVNLFDCFDTPVATAITDADGLYFFSSLITGAYRLQVIPPAQYTHSPVHVGADTALDSDVDPVTGWTDCFAIVDGQDDMMRDAGLVPTGAIESGCTHGLGYWKNGTGFGKQEDRVTAWLPIWLGSPGGVNTILVADAEDARDVLQMFTYGHPSNGITKLYARLLAAKLNVAAGASGDDILQITAEADAFLAGTGWPDWEDLNPKVRQQISQWRAALASYSDGEIGPGSCNDGSGY